LAGQVEPLRATKHLKVENLFVITSGAIPPNPAELLGSQRMNEVIKDLQQHFDYIFIDSSPVLPVSDALHVATMVNGVLFVVDGQKTPRQVVKRARLRLTNSRIKILGVLLNRVDVKQGSYADYYGQYYNYYAPEEQEKERA
jgi:capsular exopolysaccharide synthesis family protein